MRSHALRLYVAAVTLLVFFVLWSVVATKPWASATQRARPDRRVVALERRQRRLQHEARLVKRTLDRRWHEYRVRLRRREARIRTLEHRHAEEVAAAARVASSTGAYAATSGTPSTATPGAQVVTLPPQVKVVTLPPAAAPATSSGSSHP